MKSGLTTFRTGWGKGSALARLRASALSWLAVFLLVLDVLASVASPAQPVRFVGAEGAALQDLALEICTIDGMAMAKPDGAAPLPSDGTDHRRHCVFCLPLLQGHLVLAGAAVVLASGPIPLAVLPVARDQQRVVLARYPSSSSPRAPPFPV